MYLYCYVYVLLLYVYVFLLLCVCVSFCYIVSFCALFVCKCVLCCCHPGLNPIEVNKYIDIISYIALNVMNGCVPVLGPSQ